MSESKSYRIIDDFLPQDLHDRLLAYALESEPLFISTQVRNSREGYFDPKARLSWSCEAGLGPLEEEFRQAIAAAEANLLRSLGLQPFIQASPEIELVAHRDGNFFSGHIDTITGFDRSVKNDRVASLVYYFHAQPRRFSGGDIILYEFGPFPGARIEACDNRLAAFLSFAPHEVERVSCPDGDRFADARFSINCWLRRPRSRKAAG